MHAHLACLVILPNIFRCDETHACSPGDNLNIENAVMI
jgi:hypothetical protein